MAKIISERKIPIFIVPHKVLIEETGTQDNVTITYSEEVYSPGHAKLILKARFFQFGGGVLEKRTKVRVPSQFNLKNIELVDMSYNVLRYNPVHNPEVKARAFLNGALLAEKNLNEGNLESVEASDEIKVEIENSEGFEFRVDAETESEIEIEATLEVSYYDYYTEYVEVTTAPNRDVTPSNSFFTF